MASRKHKFSVFMNDVIKEANKRVDLENLFELKKFSFSTVDMVSLIIKRGWNVFLPLIAILILSPTLFAASIIGFLTTPVGIIIAAILGVSTLPKIRMLYKNRALPLAIAEVGKEFKPQWENVEGNQEEVDRLMYRAADCLIKKAKQSQIDLLLGRSR